MIVNEFGEIGIDHQLVIGADEEIFEMNNGCICCAVRRDLIRIIGNLMQRQQDFDYLLIETTGLADPGPVIQSFFVDEVMAGRTQLDAVVTVVDARHIHDHWESSEAKEQIAFADVILLRRHTVQPRTAGALHRSRVRFEVAEQRGAFWKEYSRFMGMVPFSPRGPSPRASHCRQWLARPRSP